jgi:Domain of unknown function (DUF4129)
LTGGQPRRSGELRSGVVIAAIAVGFTLATALVAMAGRAPLSRGAPVNAVSARAPVGALFVLFIGAGIVALGGLVTLVWVGRRRRQDDEPELVGEPLQVHWLWKVLAVLVPLALGAALIAAVVFGLKNVQPRSTAGATQTLDHPHGPAPAGAVGSTFAVPSWLPWTVLAIAVLAVAIGGLWLWRRRTRFEDESVAKSAARAAVDAAITALEETTDPRGAVIAAYAAMERTLAARGVARRAAEAPREYLARVLVETSGAAADARSLTNLFEEARFSLRPISERSRRLALAALSSVRVHLAAEGAG